MPFIEQLGMQAAQAGVGGILGLALGGLQNQQQYRQQQRLQALQISGQKEMTDYNMAKQLQMWHDTNYGAQMQELSKAGLNPSLLYGMSGGGGTTTGNTSTNVTSTQATKGGNALAEVGMGLQLQLLQAQKENIQADTANKQAENPNIPKAGEKLTAETGRITAETGNIQADTNLKNIQSAISKIEQTYAGQTLDARIEMIGRQVELITQEAKQLNLNNAVNRATIDDRIKQIKAEAVGAILKNYLTAAETQNQKAQAAYTGKETQYVDRKYINQTSQVMAEWDKVKIASAQEQDTWLKQLEEQSDVPNEIKDLIKIIIGVGVVKGITPNRNPIGYKW